MTYNELNHSLVNNYLKKLDKNLSLLSKGEREQQINEIKDHIYENVQDKVENGGMNADQAVQETINKFLPPEKLAEEILNAEKPYYEKNFINKGDTFFRYGLMCAIGSLGGLSIPILKGEFNFGLILPFILVLVAGIILLNTKHIQWNQIQLKNIKWVSRIIIAFLSVPFAFFAVRIIKENSINLFSLYYLIGFIIVAIGLYMYLRSLYFKHIA
ncbi:HAAS signaling domain-containing protein [Priestia megaterium]